ncbi:MAG: molybdopterin-dependent oxidoreductase [Myxococcota bacterium]
MARRYDLLEVKALGRRLFIKAGGAVVLASVLPACEVDADVEPLIGPGVDVQGDPAPSTPDVVDDRASGTDTEAVQDSVVEPEPRPEPCDEWTPDPLGEGADAHPFESAPPPGGWGDEIPPISQNNGHYVTNYFGVASVDPCEWRLDISIRGETVASLDLETVYGMAGQDKEHTLQCIESRPILMKMDNAVWTGRPLKDVLNELGVTLDASLNGMRLISADSYEVGLPVSELDVPVWMVWEMNGEPLPPEHGFPVRLLCPDRFGWQNVKQLIGLDFIEGDPMPEYQKIWKTHYVVQALIAYPETMALSTSGETVRILGKAYAGSDPVVWVGISLDGGETYEDAELTYAPGPDRWTLWRFDWTPSEPGNYVLTSHARTASGLETELTSDLAIPYTDGMAIMLKVS